MPDMELNEAIRILSNINMPMQLGITQQDALKLAISKLSLLIQVEKGRVKKKEIDWKAGRTIHIGLDYDAGFNSAIDLCNADLARRLEGIEEVIINTMSKINKEPPEVYQVVSEYLSQAIITHLTGGGK